MTSSTDNKGAKKRAGRKRLPPLAPGPALQFVVASHPDDFKADNTMRNVRSHVMYKHRGEQQRRSGSPAESSRSKRGSTRTTPLPIMRTPSPMATISDGNLDDISYPAPSVRRRSTIWDGEIYRFLSQSPTPNPARDLAQRIITASTAEPARSAPPTFDQGSEYPFPSNFSTDAEPLDDLKNLYIDCNDLCHDGTWMEIVCSNRMSFLSNVTASCVYQDVSEGLLEDSSLTMYAKTKVARMIQDAFQDVGTYTDDFTTLSILHLLVSEIGGAAEASFDGHLGALTRIVHERGGLRNLGIDGRVATFLTVVLLTISVLRGHGEFPMLQGFAPSCPPSAVMSHPPPISPLFAPQGDLSALYGSCSTDTYRILCNMHELTRTFIHRWNYANDAYAQTSPNVGSYESHMQQIYTRLLLFPSTTDVQVAPDWVYESCRLAALIYCRSIVQGMPLSDSADIVLAPSSNVAFAGVTMLRALHDALMNTDKNSNWGDMYGVFMWICLVGGAAAWPPRSQDTYGISDEGPAPTAWMKKWFALFAVKSSLGGGFEQALAATEAQRTMLQVQNLIGLKGGIASQ